MTCHRGSGQTVVRFVDHPDRANRGPIQDVYLGVHGSDGVEGKYEEERRVWIELSLEVGWAPAEWKPAETGHEGVLTVGELVAGYRVRMDDVWGLGWQRVGVDPCEVEEWRAALERGWSLIRRGRRRGNWGGDREMVREGKQLVAEARVRFGHLDEACGKLWYARVLDDLEGDYGPWAAAVLGDRELRRLRKKWAEEGRSLSDRKTGMGVVRDAYCYVVGRQARAEWDLAREYLEQNADQFGLDRGIVRADGRWVRTP